MRKKKSYIFQVMFIGSVLRLLSNLLWKSFNYKDLYFQGIAVFGICACWYWRQNEKSQSFGRYLIADFFFNLAATKLITEIFFEATKVQVYEYWNLALCGLIFIIRSVTR